MSERFINIDRDTPMLLPPDLRDWVEDDDIVHFILDVAYRVSTDLAQVNRRGTGSAQYPPSMMLALLLYCYSQGIYSSRKIERATYANVSVRYLTADHHPDHDTIAAFRRKNKDFIEQAFVMTLQIAHEVGLTKLGTMAIDGTSLRANAGKKTTCDFGSLEDRIESLCEDRVQKAENADAEGCKSANERHCMPSKNSLEEAHAKIKATHERRRKQRDEMRKEVEEAKVGSLPYPLPKDISPSKKVNLVDTDCHFMPMKEGYYAPGYNAQLAVDTDSMLITAALISTGSVDNQQLLRVARTSQRNCKGSVKTVIADSGYDNNYQINELQKQCGIEAVVAVKDPHRLSTKHNQNQRRQNARNLKLKRLQVLKTQRAKKLLKQRASSVETAFGVIKHAMQFKAFLLRGEANVGNEWNLVSAAFNLKRLANMGIGRSGNRPNWARRNKIRALGILQIS